MPSKPPGLGARLFTSLWLAAWFLVLFVGVAAAQGEPLSTGSPSEGGFPVTVSSTYRL